MLAQWTARSTGVDGLIAAMQPAGDESDAYLEVDGERVTSVLDEGDGLVAGPLLYAQTRELCETVGEERDKYGDAGAFASGLSRLAYWYELRRVIYEGRSCMLRSGWDILDGMRLFFDLWSEGEESPGETFEKRADGVFIGRDVRIDPSAHIAAPALIGDGCVIGANTVVRGSMLGTGCIVGDEGEVLDSYLAAGVALRGDNYVSGSVIGHGASLAHGARTDHRPGASTPGTIVGAGAHIGERATLGSGIRIGAGAAITPDSAVTADVPGTEGAQAI